jgi:hypothetical protein
MNNTNDKRFRASEVKPDINMSELEFRLLELKLLLKLNEGNYTESEKDMIIEFGDFTNSLQEEFPDFWDKEDEEYRQADIDDLRARLAEYRPFKNKLFSY